MKIIFKNLFSLGLVQISSLLVPLVLTPYLVKTVGLELYGVIATAQSVVIFFSIFTDFGFNVTGVRRLAYAKNNETEIATTLNIVFFSKLVLLIISLLIFVPLILIVPHFSKYSLVFLGSFVMLIGNTLLPHWFYQGIEKLTMIMAPSLIFKVLNVILIFLFVKTKSDAPYVNILFGLSNILTSIWLYYFIFKKYKLSLQKINFSALYIEIKKTSAMFISNIGNAAYSNSTILILSFFVTPYMLGMYSVIDKILQLLRSVLMLIYQVIYPRLCNLVSESIEVANRFLKQIYSIIWAGIFLFCLIIFLNSVPVVSYFVKDKDAILFTGKLLRYISMVVFIMSLNMPFYQMLLALKKDWLIVRIVFICTILSITLNLILIPVFKIYGVIISMYIVESLYVIFMVYFMLAYQKNMKTSSYLQSGKSSLIERRN